MLMRSVTPSHGVGCCAASRIAPCRMHHRDQLSPVLGRAGRSACTYPRLVASHDMKHVNATSFPTTVAVLLWLAAAACRHAPDRSAREPSPAALLAQLRAYSGLADARLCVPPLLVDTTGWQRRSAYPGMGISIALPSRFIQDTHPLVVVDEVKVIWRDASYVFWIGSGIYNARERPTGSKAAQCLMRIDDLPTVITCLALEPTPSCSAAGLSAIRTRGFGRPQDRSGPHHRSDQGTGRLPSTWRSNQL
jgi:hypothetical protein